MGDEIPNRMNLDLNLGPLPAADNEPELEALNNESVNLEDWIEGSVSRLRENLRLRARQRWRSVWRPRPVRISPETRDLGLEFVAGSSIPGAATVQTGEGSASPEERSDELAKSCESNMLVVVDDAARKKETEEKGVGEEGSFFDCNICLDLASNPVVTCCGHLFCWPCLYRWLHVHSEARECPVCKGEVLLNKVTPIYGRGNSSREPQEEDPSLKIPMRPQGRRIESWRQTVQRNAFSIPMEEMIRRLGSRFDLARDLTPNQPQNADGAGDATDRHSSLLNRILTSRGMRREQNAVIPPTNVGDVGVRQSSPTNYEAGESRRLSSILMRRSHAHRAITISNLTSTLSSAERLVDSYFRYHPVEGNEEQLPPVDDRDSVSSIAAVINSGSQTLDTNVEIDSTVSLSTSSSRRRNDNSRVSDVDSGDSRAHRRRRLN